MGLRDESNAALYQRHTELANEHAAAIGAASRARRQQRRIEAELKRRAGRAGILKSRRAPLCGGSS